MDLKTALDKHYLRPVRVQANGYPEKYKGQKPLDYHQLMNQKIALINLGHKFLIAKNQVIATMTVSSNTDKALIYAPDHASSSSAFLTVVLTKATLNSQIIDYANVKTYFEPLNLVEILAKALQKPKELTDKELVNLALNRDSLTVLEKTDFTKLTANALLLELFLQKTPRARLASLEASKFGKIDKALPLFKPQEQALLKLADRMVG